MALKPRYATWQILPAALLLALLLALALWFGARGIETATAAESFPGQGFLPDNRAWEMVSPPDKNGGEALPSSAYTQPKLDCTTDCAVLFASLAAFGDQQGLAGSYGQYISRRLGEQGTQGWSTHGITPPQQPPAIPVVAQQNRFGFRGEFAPDLSIGTFRALSAVPTADDPHPNVTETFNLYRRTDVLVPGSGSFELLTDSLVPQPYSGVANNRPRYAAANTGTESSLPHSTVAFEDNRQLADADPGTTRRLFINALGTTRVVDQVPAVADPICGGADPACESTTSSAISGVNGGTQTATLAWDFQNLEQQHVVSADGSRVFYRAPVNTSGHPVAGSRLYLRDDQGTHDPSDDTYTRIQHSEKTTPEAPVSAKFWYATEDGTQAFFSTTEGLVDGDDNGSADIYRYTHSDDPTADANLTRVSIDDEGADAPDVSQVVAATPDASHVYFTAGGELEAGQPALASGPGLYLWHDGDVSFVGEFKEQADVLVNSLDAPNRIAAVERRTASSTADDGTLLFALTDSSGFNGVGGFDSYDHGFCGYFLFEPIAPNPAGCRQYFVFSPSTGSLRCATCNPSGAPADGHAITAADPAGLVGPAGADQPSTSRPISKDGKYVFFSSDVRLVAEDANGPCDELGKGPCTDAYVYDTTTERIHLLSSGTSDSKSWFVDASADGSDVFIATREPLSAWDTDGAYDIYDARIDGGFPEPMPEAECADADECRGASSGGPGEEELGSGGFEGEGNLQETAPPDCSGSESKVDRAKKKLRRAKNKASNADGKKAEKSAKRARKRAKKRLKAAKRTLQRCRGGNS